MYIRKTSIQHQSIIWQLLMTIYNHEKIRTKTNCPYFNTYQKYQNVKLMKKWAYSFANEILHLYWYLFKSH